MMMNHKSTSACLLLSWHFRWSRSMAIVFWCDLRWSATSTSTAWPLERRPLEAMWLGSRCRWVFGGGMLQGNPLFLYGKYGKTWENLGKNQKHVRKWHAVAAGSPKAKPQHPKDMIFSMDFQYRDVLNCWAPAMRRPCTEVLGSWIMGTSFGSLCNAPRRRAKPSWPLTSWSRTAGNRHSWHMLVMYVHALEIHI